MSTEIIVEHKASGAPKNERGDGVLSMTNGVYAVADTFMSQFVGSGVPATDYASILFFLNPETGSHTILHYQPKYTRFPEYNRYYDTRILYELTDKEFEKCQYSYSSLADKLTLMKDYGQRIYDASNVITVDVPSSIVLNPIEEGLKSALYDALANQKQIFIQLGENDKSFGDEVRHSAKLKSILRVFGSMPMEIRKYLSLGYAVENISNGIRWLSPYLSVIAHFDDLSNWDIRSANVAVIDWAKDTPAFSRPMGDPSEQQKRIIECLPMLSDFYGTSLRTFNSFSSLFKTIPDEIDGILKTNVNSVTRENFARLIYLFHGGKRAYRHKDLSKYLLLAVLGGIQVGVGETDLLKAYPELREDKSVQRTIISIIGKTFDLDALTNFDKEYGSFEEISKAIRERVITNIEIMDCCAANKDNPLSKKYKEDIRKAIGGFPNEEKLDRLDTVYYGLSINSLNIKSWEEFSKLYNHINQGGFDKKLLNKLPFDLNWKDDITESIYLLIKDRLNAQEEETLRQKCIDCYFTKPAQRFLLGDNWLKDDEIFELLKTKSIASKDKKDLIKDYLNRKHESNMAPDCRISEYYSLVAPLNRSSLSSLARFAIDYGWAFEDQLLNDIKSASVIGENYEEHRKGLLALQHKAISEVLESQYNKIQLDCVPKKPEKIIELISKKDYKTLKLICNNNQLETIYDLNGFIRYYEDLCGNAKNIRFLRKHKLLEAFLNNFKKKADEYIKSIFYSGNTLMQIDKLFEGKHINDCPNASKYLIHRLAEQDDEKIIALYKIFIDYYGQHDGNRGQLKNDVFWGKALRVLLPKWKELNPSLSLPSNEKEKLKDILKRHKTPFISIVAVLLLGGVTLMAIIISHHQSPEPVPGLNDTTLRPLPIAIDSLYIHITVGDDDTNAMWQRFPLDSLHPNVIIANTILDTLFIRTISTNISMYYVCFCESKRMVSDTTRVSITKDNIHSVSRLLPIDSAYRSYLTSSERKDKYVCDTLTYVCGKDTVRVAPGESLLQQIIGDVKYRTDTVSFVVRGSDTTTLIFGDFIKKNTTRRYLQTTDYYLWAIQQISRSQTHFSNN